MNDRIRELAEQVNIIKQPNTDYTISEQQLKEFAELIIKEATGIVIDVMPYYADHACDVAITKVNKHFGVE